MGAVEEETVELQFDRYRVSVWDDENILDMDSTDGCKTVYYIYLMPLSCTFTF